MVKISVDLIIYICSQCSSVTSVCLWYRDGRWERGMILKMADGCYVFVLLSLKCARAREWQIIDPWAGQLERASEGGNGGRFSVEFVEKWIKWNYFHCRTARSLKTKKIAYSASRSTTNWSSHRDVRPKILTESIVEAWKKPGLAKSRGFPQLSDMYQRDPTWSSTWTHRPLRRPTWTNVILNVIQRDSKRDLNHV